MAARERSGIGFLGFCTSGVTQKALASPSFDATGTELLCSFAHET